LQRGGGMAWEIAKGILIAAAILFIVIPLALAMLYLVGFVGVSIIGAIFRGPLTKRRK